ncbi:MAG: FliA/WhiG family RNA polymerase sigma factor [Deltaproteobacteria bacterium]|nr:FliA/WhiG family RNA polymerase sigma factor [Deltaproteobacteria bacterium]
MKGSSQGVNAYLKTPHPGSSLTPEEREKLILDYSSLIRYIAGRIAMRLPSHLQIDDLISAGVLGLIDAVDKYDASRNAKFKTYAEYRIRGAILDELRAMDWVPRSVRRKSQQMEEAFQTLSNELGREPSDEEMAGHLDLDLEEYHQMIDDTAGVGLFAIVDTSGGLSRFIPGTLVENALKDDSDNPADYLDKNEIKEVIARAIDKLTEKEKMVISLYYYDELTMKETGQVLNYTESRICQIHSKVMMKLRARLRRYFEELV